MTASTSQATKPSNILHVQKRRRISKATTSPSSSMATKILGPATNRGSSQSSTCGSCYRYIGMNISNATQCARCLSTSCTICSRTCTAYKNSQPSVPNPAWSQTTTLASSKRGVASSLSAEPNALLPEVNPHSSQSAKRKKIFDDDEATKSVQEAEEDGFRDVIVAGCGRVVCRNCCAENIAEGTTSCHDCLNS